MGKPMLHDYLILKKYDMILHTRQWIMEAGYTKESDIAAILTFIHEQELHGMNDPKYLLKRIKKIFGSPKGLSCLRGEIAPLAEAIDATTAQEVETIHAVRRRMNELLRAPVIKRGALMPDACIANHQTAAMPVGGAIEAIHAIIPAAHSADICCSMSATVFESDLTITELLDRLASVTRFGAGGRKRHEWVDHKVLREDVWGNPFLRGLEEKAAMHLADQGDGNHFAYIGEMELSDAQVQKLTERGYSEMATALGKRSYKVLVTHHGSRGLGAHLYKRGLHAAVKQCDALDSDIPESMAWLDTHTEQGKQYWEALEYTGRWTRANHELIHQGFVNACSATAIATIANEHNYVWKRGDSYFHGKGATPAWKDEQGRGLLGLIPLNMCEPILVVIGNDHADYLSFAPHGAGRNLSRTAFMRKLKEEHHLHHSRDYELMLQKATQGIEVRWFSGKPDLTETSIAYKDPQRIREQIASYGLAEIVAEIRPLGCIMAGQQKSWKEIREEHLTPKQQRQIENRADRRKLKQSKWHEADDEDFG